MSSENGYINTHLTSVTTGSPQEVSSSHVHNSHLHVNAQLHQEVSELLADVDAFEFAPPLPPSPAGPTFGQLATATRACVSESVHLWMSLERLYRSAGRLRPVHLRAGAGACGSEKNLAGRALCPFASAELRLCESDDLLLVDRSDPYLWRVGFDRS